MPVNLIFLFLFQSGLAFAFSFFITRILLGGSDENSHKSLLKGLGWIRNLFIGACLVLPPLMFIAYYESLPDDTPASMAIWPAFWIFMILAAVALALTIAPATSKASSKGT